ncbi:hypothetical protein HPB48_026564 [Haemaphysalis longicornis]|uniref:Uncharacterized protein n=1 Tax=Haemaphysalis longicornis TaxID=44386 RepID=A0A9J6HB26_HAELO|nr:hypothetical protein HPB48_026564 [Haemaphysalis longicornis]
MSTPAGKRYRRYLEPGEARDEPDEGSIGEQNASEDSDTDDYDSEGVSDSEHADDFFDCTDSADDSTPFDCGDEDIKHFFEKCAHEVLPNSAINKAQAILLVLTYVVFAGLTWTQVDGLLKLINTLCGAEVVPRSKFLFRKMWQRHKDSLSAHFFCETCFSYLGARDRKDRAHCFSCASCGDCDRKSVSSLLTKGCFFLVFDIGKQIYDIVFASAVLLYEGLRRGASVLHE